MTAFRLLNSVRGAFDGHAFGLNPENRREIPNNRLHWFRSDLCGYLSKGREKGVNILVDEFFSLLGLWAYGLSAGETQIQLPPVVVQRS